MRPFPRFVLFRASALACGVLLAPLGATAEEEGPIESGFGVEIRAPRYDRDAAIAQVDAGKPFTGVLVLSGTHPKPLPVRCVALRDYRQVPLVIGGAGAPSHPLLVPTDAPLTVVFSVPPPAGEGEHVVTFVLFFFPDQHADREDFRTDSQFLFQDLSLRVRWGGSTAPAIEAVECPAGGEEDELANEGLARFELLPESGEKGAWRRADGNGADAVASFNNPDPDSARPFVLLAFMDWVQVPFAGDDPALCRELPPLGGIALDGKVPGVRDDEPHEFVLLLVEDPFPPADGKPMPSLHSSPRLLVQHK